MRSSLIGCWAAACTASVLVIEDRKHWTSLAAEFQEEDQAFVLFHTPWCKHCKRALPDFEKAASHALDWPASFVNRTVFGTFDCDTNRAACARLQYFQFPTIALTDREGNPVEEFPDLPRRTSSFLSWLAFKRRKAPFISANSADQYRLNIQKFTHDCHSEEAAEDLDFTFARSLCRYLKSRKYMIGTATALRKVNEAEPLAPTAIVEFEVPEELADSTLPTSGHICLIDQYGLDERACLEAADTEHLRQFIKDNQWTTYVDLGDWQTFFELKERVPEKKIVVAAVYDIDTKTPNMLKNILRESNDLYGMTWSFLREATEPLLGQLDIPVSGTYPIVVVFHPRFADRAFYVYPQGKELTEEGLRNWIRQVLDKQVKPQYPAGMEPGVLATVKRELRATLKVFRNVRDNMPLSGWIKLIGGFSGSLISVALLYWFTSDTNDEAMERLSRRVGPIAPQRRPGETSSENAAGEVPKKDAPSEPSKEVAKDKAEATAQPEETDLVAGKAAATTAETSATSRQTKN